jgi:hypothetical protein
MRTRSPRSPRFCFIELQTPQQARKTIEILDGFKLDKAHVFEAMAMADFTKYVEMKDDFEAPVIKNYEEKECLISWLMDEQAIIHPPRPQPAWSENRSRGGTAAGGSRPDSRVSLTGSRPICYHPRPNWHGHHRGLLERN